MVRPGTFIPSDRMCSGTAQTYGKDLCPGSQRVEELFTVDFSFVDVCVLASNMQHIITTLSKLLHHISAGKQTPTPGARSGDKDLLSRVNQGCSQCPEAPHGRSQQRTETSDAQPQQRGI